MSMALTMVVRDGLLSWKRSPPRRTISTHSREAMEKISSKVLKESSQRMSSFSQTPCSAVEDEVIQTECSVTARKRG